MVKLTILNVSDGTEIPSVFYKQKFKNNNSKNFVFFHGLGTSKDEYLDFYRNLALKLSFEGHNILCFDARAHGESNKNSNEFSILNFISDGIEAIKWVINSESIEKVTLFGTSFGAIPSLCISSLLPEIVEKIYLLAPVLDLNKSYLNPITEDRIKKYKGLFRLAILEGNNFKITERLFFNRHLVSEFALISLPDIIKTIPLDIEIMHGTHDTMVPFQTSEQISSESEKIHFHKFLNMDHGFMEIGDETGVNKSSKENINRIINILTN